MHLDQTIMQKIQTIQLLTKQSEEEILNKALDMYMQAQQELIAQEQRKETTLTYDEFWEGVDFDD